MELPNKIRIASLKKCNIDCCMACDSCAFRIECEQEIAGILPQFDGELNGDWADEITAKVAQLQKLKNDGYQVFADDGYLVMFRPDINDYKVWSKGVEICGSASKVFNEVAATDLPADYPELYDFLLGRVKTEGL